MFLIIFGISPILISGQILVTDLVDAVSSEERLIKYLKEESVPYTGKVYNYYDNGVKELEGNYVRGLKEGKWIWWHTNGKRHKTGYFNRSVEDSLWQWWFAKGQLKKRGEYVDSLKEGRWSEWFSDGNLSISFSYLNDKLNGKSIERH